MPGRSFFLIRCKSIRVGGGCKHKDMLLTCINKSGKKKDITFLEILSCEGGQSRSVLRIESSGEGQLRDSLRVSYLQTPNLRIRPR